MTWSTNLGSGPSGPKDAFWKSQLLDKWALDKGMHSVTGVLLHYYFLQLGDTLARDIQIPRFIQRIVSFVFTPGDVLGS